MQSRSALPSFFLGRVSTYSFNKPVALPGACPRQHRAARRLSTVLSLGRNLPAGAIRVTGFIGRREFITLLATAWPIAARAQRAAKTARIGFLGADTQSGIESRLERFRGGLRDLGYVEGDNVLIDFRWAEGNYARLAEFAGELVRLKVDLLVTYGTPGTLAAKQATTTVPIVMIVSGDAIATGIVTSLAHPGKNVTGSTFFAPQLSAKGVELVKEALPSVSRVAILLNPDNPVMAPVLDDAHGRQTQVGVAAIRGTYAQRFSKRVFEDHRDTP